MLQNGIVLLTILIEFLVQILTIVEWISPSKNILIITLIILSFRSRWTWNAVIPSIIVYSLPKIKDYIQAHIRAVQELSKLDLLLSVNSLTQHALLLKDRLLWLFQSEIDFFLQMMKGDLSFEARLLIISLIFIFLGYFNWTSTILEIFSLHLLLKHSKVGPVYHGIARDILKFLDFALFYKNVRLHQFKVPFKLENDQFTVIIIETVDIKNKSTTKFVPETGGIIYFTPEFLVLLKPIVEKMTESISDWMDDFSHSKRYRIWKWTRPVHFDYNSEELDFFRNIYDIIIT